MLPVPVALRPRARFSQLLPARASVNFSFSAWGATGGRAAVRAAHGAHAGAARGAGPCRPRSSERESKVAQSGPAPRARGRRTEGARAAERAAQDQRVRKAELKALQEEASGGAAHGEDLRVVGSVAALASDRDTHTRLLACQVRQPTRPRRASPPPRARDPPRRRQVLETFASRSAPGGAGAEQARARPARREALEPFRPIPPRRLTAAARAGGSGAAREGVGEQRGQAARAAGSGAGRPPASGAGRATSPSRPPARPAPPRQRAPRHCQALARLEERARGVR